MVNWAQMRDCCFDADRVPELLELLERVEHRDDAEAWKESGWRLVFEHGLVSPASLAALPDFAAGADGWIGRLSAYSLTLGTTVRAASPVSASGRQPWG